MKVDYSKYPEIPKGCQLNYNKARNVYQVFREHRVTDPASGKRKTHRQTIGQIKDGIFSFSKLWLERKKNEALQAKLNGFSPDNTVPATQTAKKIRSSLEAAECEQRDERRIVFPLEPIAQAAVMSALSGATDCSEIAMFYNDHKDLFGTLYDHLPEFPLSADTVYRAFMKIEPGRFEVFYEQLLSHLLSLSPTNPQVMDGNGRTIRVISADGQAIRATSKNKGSSRIHDYHMLMNFYDINKRICLKQKLIDKKTNEISVGPSMLQNLDITGSVVTADAMSCQMRFVEAVLDGGADYCISLKGNQERSLEEVRLLFATTHPDQILNLPSSVELDHGRIEQRTIEIIRGSLLSTVLRDKWRGVDKGCVIKVTSSRQYKKAGQSQNEERYYISSLPFNSDTVLSMDKIIRCHWAIENNLHWLLDVNFLQDRIQARNEEYITNRAALNKLALAMLENYRFWLWNNRKTSELLSIKAIKQHCREWKFALECIACSQGLL